MTRLALATTLGALVTVTGVLLMLAGSDLPPPVGFLWVVIAGLGLGVLVRVLACRGCSSCVIARGRSAPWLPPRLSGRQSGPGVAIPLVTWSPGEPSAPRPGPVEVSIFLLVVAVVGACAAVALAPLAILADRADSRTGALLVVGVPGLLTVLLIVAVIVQRLIGS